MAITFTVSAERRDARVRPAGASCQDVLGWPGDPEAPAQTHGLSVRWL